MIRSPGTRAMFMVALAGWMVLVGTVTVTRAVSSPEIPPALVESDDPVLITAGDVAECGSDGDTATAALVAGIDGTVALLGDAVYSSGTGQEFAECFAPTWGQFKDRTRPAPGNHDYQTQDASGYFGYFGAAAGNTGEGWYSYDLGEWHIVVLNSNCDHVGCTTGSPQVDWLQSDLAAHPGACTLAYWHHPRFSSGSHHGGDEAMAPIWSVLFDAGADVVLAGHEHNYERFAPLDAAGRLDLTNGIRSFVVGTGGRSHYGFGRPEPGSEVRESDTYGVLALTLHPGGYEWTFVPVSGETFRDEGTALCHE